MNDLKILMPGSFKSSMDAIKRAHSICPELEAMILMTVGTCILSANRSWNAKDYEELKNDLTHTVAFFKEKNEKAKQNERI